MPSIGFDQPACHPSVLGEPVGPSFGEGPIVRLRADNGGWAHNNANIPGRYKTESFGCPQYYTRFDYFASDSHFRALVLLIPVAIFLLWLLLFFARSTWGVLIDVFPMSRVATPGAVSIIKTEDP